MADGEDVVAAVGGGGRRPFTAEVLPADGSGLLRASAEERRVLLGEPACTAGCRGPRTVPVRRRGALVERSGRQLPAARPLLPDLHVDAGRYVTEPARATAEHHRPASPA
ncbi:hypothetical protein ACFCX4_04765 [Kitasatospora sp. NPDC056327]|uniref:hypothetical protein n=1 Tax=Kitasatospora sp. NPDC056327 TaxID=3345785 RepID=UPI0035E2BF7A